MRSKRQQIEEAWVRWKRRPEIDPMTIDAVTCDYLKAAFLAGAWAGERAEKAWGKRRKGARS